MQKTDKMLTPAEAAKVLRIGRSSIYRILSAGEIACLRIGKKIIIPEKAIDIYISRQICYNGHCTIEMSEPVLKGE